MTITLSYKQCSSIAPFTVHREGFPKSDCRWKLACASLDSLWCGTGSSEAVEMNGCEVSELDGRQVSLSRPLHIETPLVKSRKLSERLSCSVWLKMETMQNSGSFKVRGIGHLCQKVCCAF